MSEEQRVDVFSGSNQPQVAVPDAATAVPQTPASIPVEKPTEPRAAAPEPARRLALPTGTTKQREDGVTLLAMYHFLLAGLTLLGTIGLSIPTVITGIVGVVEDSDALIATFILGSLAVVTMVLSLFLLIVGYGLWTQRQWGRVAAIAIGMLGLFAIPIGTIIGGATIWYLAKPEVAAEFR